MSPESDARPAKPIIIIKKKGGDHGGHHGGAWKVAYADFVTAMMALFIVLWLMSADKEVQEAVSFYFNNPSGPGSMKGTAAAGVGHSIEIPKDDMKKLAEKIQQALMSVPNFRNLKDHVEITVTSDGLRIELLETEAGMFFESGKPVPSESGANLLTTLAVELGKMPNNILIEGHTDAKPFGGDGSYSNWELSADRANSARKIMEAHGLRPGQVAQVRGYADRQLRHADDPEGASNRRISVIVQYLSPPPGQPGKDAEKKGEKGAEEGAEKSAPAGKKAAASPESSAAPAEKKGAPEKK
jgi:chemotaxis protein MotB